jgi:hypothetical protein
MSMIGGAMVVQNLLRKTVTRGKISWRDKKNKRKRKIKQKEINSRTGDSGQNKEPKQSGISRSIVFQGSQGQLWISPSLAPFASSALLGVWRSQGVGRKGMRQSLVVSHLWPAE